MKGGMLEGFDRGVEAIVFAADTPPSPDEVARAWARVTGAEVTATDVDASVRRLNTAYQAGGHAFRIHHWGQGYRLATVEEVAPLVQVLLQHEEERRLSRALVETLAVVAYKQPVSKPEVDHVRGVDADYALQQLLERDLITVVGRSAGVGRPLLYGTTEYFLDQFALGTLEELPRPREIEDLLADPAFSRERSVLTTELEALRTDRHGGDGAAETPPEDPPADA